MIATTKKFRPANGTIGESFMTDFCGTCGLFFECEIYQRAMNCNINDPDYPIEWICDEKDGARCTAYACRGK